MKKKNQTFWWEKEENKTTIEIPVSIVKDRTAWVVGCNSETKKKIGGLGGTVQGDTREEAIDEFFKTMRFVHHFNLKRSLSYERWVPLILGPWGSIGGNWITIFGMNFNFRYGKNLKHGWYIPFTKLNISFHNKWKTYNKFVKENKPTWDNKN